MELIRPSLPSISSEPVLHHGCCLRLSTTILDRILLVLPKKPSKIMSIGSGSGLLEELLMNSCPDIDIEGVEVNSSVNKYLPSQQIRVVKGTWDLCHEAQQVEAWIFVYPRSPELLKSYLDLYGISSSLQRVIWIGPIVDWESFKPSFDQADIQQLELISLSSFEIMVVFEVYSGTFQSLSDKEEASARREGFREDENESEILEVNSRNIYNTKFLYDITP